jgi:hypothetical protein
MSLKKEERLFRSKEERSLCLKNQEKRLKNNQTAESNLRLKYQENG